RVETRLGDTDNIGMNGQCLHPLAILSCAVDGIHRMPSDDPVYILIFLYQIHCTLYRFTVESHNDHFLYTSLAGTLYHFFKVVIILVCIEMYMCIYHHCHHSTSYCTVLPFSIPSGIELSVRFLSISAVRIMPSERSQRSLTG